VINAGTLQAIADVTSTRSIQLGDSTSTILVDATKTYTVSGVFSDGAATGTLNKTGPGALVLAGTNTYSGGTNVAGGTLQVGAGGTAGTLGTGAISTSTGATLAYKHSDDVTLSNPIGGSGNFAQTGTGAVIFTGTNTYGGTTTISSGTLQVGNNDATGALGTGAVTNNALLKFTRTDTTTVASTIGGTGTINQTNGALNLNGAVTGQSVHAISGAINLGAGDTGGTNPTHALAAVTIDSGSHVQLTLGGAKVLSATSLGTSGTGFLDLTNNAFILNYAGSTEIQAQTDAVAAMLTAGFNGGNWDGPGINTSKVATDQAADPTHYQYLTGLGYMSGALMGSSFLGRAIDPGTVLVRYTYYGDADLSGTVNGNDYTLIDSAYAALHDTDVNTTAAITWVNGDFNYDGKIDGADYALIDTAAAFTNGQPLAPEFIEARESQFGEPYAQQIALLNTNVPEPATFGMLLLGGALLGLRRRRSRP
jgi:autotransporter-associated beta strand protein